MGYTRRTHTLAHCCPGNRSQGGGMMGAHMLSSHNGSRFKGTMSAGGRGREIDVQTLMLESGTKHEMKHSMELNHPNDSFVAVT